MKVYDMAKKKKQKQPHIDKSPIRKRKAKTWINTYAGADIVKDYRAHFKGVDVACAVRELQEIGYEFEQDYLNNLLRAESVCIGQLHRRKEAKRQEEEHNDWQDDRFYFTAGHTSGGAPYGVTWEEMGLEPWEKEIDDEEEIIPYRDYDLLGKRETEYINNRLREGFSEYVNTHGKLPGKVEQEELIQKVFSTCAGGELFYHKGFLSTYRKIIRKRYNRYIREGISKDLTSPVVDSNEGQNND